MRSVVIHAHFYQPPREHPFFDEVDAEPSAAPYHDWNERIDRECYRAVVAARVLGPAGRIARVVNTLESLSFNVGPTLLTWLERHSADTYRAILAADAESCRRLGGHGNAIAHPYHHVILPLASRRDKVTEVRWGMADFRRRFGRDPEGFWLPETAVDDETLDVLAQEGIRFTVLAPYQVKVRPPNGLPGRYTTASGRTIALCTYDGDLSHGIAFGGLVRDAEHWARELLARQPDPRPAAEHHAARAASREARARPQLIAMATDGETYGHHHRFAEMALARVFEISASHGVRVENFATFLARHPATVDVELVAPSAWSCAHGVERWRSNCGCRTDAQRAPSQAWRTPLRDGLNTLAASLHELFEREGSALLGDPWAARDAYGDAVSHSAEARQAFARQRLVVAETPARRRRAAELLEMERDALRMFTSCAWFFDDIGGLEVQQVLRYAARAIDLSGDDRLAVALAATLQLAASNDPRTESGADVFGRLAAQPDAAARTAAAAVALKALGVDPNGHLAAHAVLTEVSGDRVTVMSRDTGAEHRFRAAVVERRASDVTCDVTSMEEDGARIWRIPLADFPERPRRAIRHKLRRALLPQSLSAADMERLALGEVSLRGVVVTALQRAVAGLHADDSREAQDVAHALLDLFEQLETNVPFDVQTAFWEVWQEAPAARRERLASLRQRLGFEVT